MRAPWVALRTGLLIALLARGSSAQTPTTVMTEAERNGLVVGTDSIRHPGLGFVLPHPGKAYRRSAEIEAGMTGTLAAHPDMATWALVGDGRENVLIIASKAPRMDEQFFREVAEGFRAGARGRPNRKILEDTLTWSGAAGEFRFVIYHAVGFYGKLRCVANATPGVGVVACISTTTVHSEELDFVRDGLTLTP